MKYKIITLTLLLTLLIVPSFSYAVVCTPDPQFDPNDANATQLCNPTEAISGSKISTFVINGLRVFAAVAGIVTIIAVVFSGFRFLLSQGNSEKVEEAKRNLQWSVSGFVLIMLAYVLVSGLRIFFDVKDIPPDSYQERPTVINPWGINNFNELYLTLINGFFTILGLIAILLIIINGFRYITARGNEEQTQQAKQGLQYAVLGVIIALFAYVLVRATATFFGAA